MMTNLIDILNKITTSIQSDTKELKSVSFKLNEKLNQEEIYQLIDYKDKEMFYLHDLEEECLAIGKIQELKNLQKNRYSQLEKEVIFLRENINYIQIDLNLHFDSQTPRIYGGVTFTNSKTQQIWKNFAPIDFFLPIIEIITRDQETVIVLNFKTVDDIITIIDMLRLEKTHVSKNGNKINGINYPISTKEWKNTIQEAHDTMDTSDLEKVVLSRMSEIETEQPLKMSKVIKNLGQNYSKCFNFIFQHNQEIFFGASPELLCRIDGEILKTVALAGTRPRGHSAIDDDRLAQELLNHPKELKEHQLVIEDIIHELQELASEIKTDDTPSILKLHNVQHLKTDISANLNPNFNSIEVIEKLHPTPALGGKPKKNALNFIEMFEKTDRGMYASPIGWIDLNLNAKIIVAIRSAITSNKLTWLYAGAGIMRQSDAEKEWEEIELKFKPILEALEVKL